MFNGLIDLCKQVWRIFIWWVVVLPWEEGIRVRMGKRRTRLKPGLRFRIPYVDAIYKQVTRLRFTTLPTQTITTRDHQTITLAGTIAFRVTDIDRLYDTVHQGEAAVCTFAQGALTAYIQDHDLAECRPSKVVHGAAAKLDFENYGLTFHSITLTTFALVRTYRFITDQLQRIYDDDLSTRHADLPAPTRGA